jgi:hypothetical protein
VDADTEKECCGDESDEAHPPVGLKISVPGAPVYVFVEEGADADHGADDAEKEKDGCLRGAGEADFFFWLSYGFVRHFYRQNLQNFSGLT